VSLSLPVRHPTWALLSHARVTFSAAARPAQSALQLCARGIWLACTGLAVFLPVTAVLIGASELAQVLVQS